MKTSLTFVCACGSCLLLNALHSTGVDGIYKRRVQSTCVSVMAKDLGEAVWQSSHQHKTNTSKVVSVSFTSTYTEWLNSRRPTSNAKAYISD